MRVLVTGASRGIGLEIARAFVRAGAHVIGTARSAEDLARIRGELGAAFEPRTIDLVDAAARDRFTQGLGGEGLTTLVNSAGANQADGIQTIDTAAWRRLLELNLTVPMELSRAVAAGMAARRSGWIVNVASVWGVRGRAGRTSYAATKTGLIGLTRSMALDLAPAGVLVNAVCPGPTDTELTRSLLTPEARASLAATIPLGRLAAPAEIASLVVYLGSSSNTFITGQAVSIDGGLTA